MGICDSMPWALDPVPARYYESLENQRWFDHLMLSDMELRMMWAAFKFFRRKRGDKKIKVLDLLRKGGIAPTPFAQRVFEIIDVDGKRVVTFPTFCVCVWNFLSMDNDGVIGFVWDIIRSETLGETIELTTVAEMIEGVLGASLSRRSRDFLAEAVTRAPSALMTGRQFWLLCTRDRAVLAPAYWMQERLKTLVGNHKMWQFAQERRRMIHNLQSWKDIVKQLKPLSRSAPGSLPGTAAVIAYQSRKKGKGGGAGGEGGVLSRRDEDGNTVMRPGGMVDVAMMKSTLEEGDVAKAGAAARAAGGDADFVAAGAVKRRNSRGLMDIKSSKKKGTSGESEGGRRREGRKVGDEGGVGDDAARRAADLMREVGGDVPMGEAGKYGAGPGGKGVWRTGGAKPLRAEVAQYVLPGLIGVVGAGTGGAWPTTPGAAKAMAFGVEGLVAQELELAPELDVVRGYYRRARKHNAPFYVLHTDNNSDAAQFSIPGAVDGVRGRWRHMRARPTKEEKLEGFRVPRGGGFFSGLPIPCVGSNSALDGEFNAEIIRIYATEKKVVEDYKPDHEDEPRLGGKGGTTIRQELALEARKRLPEMKLAKEAGMVTRGIEADMLEARGEDPSVIEAKIDEENQLAAEMSDGDGTTHALPSLVEQHMRIEDEMNRIENEAAERHDAAADEYERVRMERIEAQERRARERRGLRMRGESRGDDDDDEGDDGEGDGNGWGDERKSEDGATPGHSAAISPEREPAPMIDDDDDGRGALH